MRNPAGKLFAVFAFLFGVWFCFSFGRQEKTFIGDAMGYYMYLPATLIFHDLDSLDKLPSGYHLPKEIEANIGYLPNVAPRSEKGYIMDKYTYGVAALELPFFAVAHGYEKINGREANGYSRAYSLAVKCSSLFYCLVGLFILYLVLRFYFSSALSLAGITFIFIGTNLLWFGFYQAGMAHVPLFFLYALLLYLTIRVHRTPRMWLFAALGFTAGFITVIRPVDVICLLIPLLFNVYDRASVAQKVAFIRRNFGGVMIMAVVFVIPLIPQILYWKQFTGHYLYYSYQGEVFHWLHPKIIEGLFYAHNGWLMYTPLMLLAIAGLFFYKRFRNIALPIVVILPVYVYIIYSWYCYNYINGFGSRPMLHMYPLLAIPFTALLQRLADATLLRKTAVLLLAFFFVSVNISFSLLQAKGILLSEESSLIYNWHMLYKLKADYADLMLSDVQELQPDESKLAKVATLGCNNFEDSMSASYVADTSHKSRFVYRMVADEEYGQWEIVVPFDRKTMHRGDWLKCSGDFMCTESPSYEKHLFVLETLHDGNITHWYGCKVDTKIGLADGKAGPDQFILDRFQLNTWSHVYFYARIHHGMQNGDVVRLKMWNTGRHEMYMDNICLEQYREKGRP